MFKTHAGPLENDAVRSPTCCPRPPRHVRELHERAADHRGRSRPSASPRWQVIPHEITPQNFVFRTREFEQMEMEYFVPPPRRTSGSSTGWPSAFSWVLRSRHPREKIRLRHHEKDELSTTRRRPPTSSSCSRGDGTSSRASQPDRLRPESPQRGVGRSGSSTSTRRAASAIPLCDRAGGGATRTMMASPRRLRRGPGRRRGCAPCCTRLRIAPHRWRCSRCRRRRRSSPRPRSARHAPAALLLRLRRDAVHRRRYRRQDRVGTPWCVSRRLRTRWRTAR